MISKLTADLPRFHENLRFVVFPFVVNTADGKLSNFVIPNNAGFVLFDSIGRPAGQPHSAFGPVQVVDGQAQVVLALNSAFIQIEEGESDPSWPGKVVGQVSITGMDSLGRVWVGRTTGISDETSLGLEFGVSSEPSALKQFAELSKWALPA